MRRALTSIGALAALSLVIVPASAATRVTRAEGECKLAGKVNIVDSFLPVNLALQMKYELRLVGRRVKAQEEVAGIVHVKNDGTTAAYFRCDVAYFDEAGQMICCSRCESVKPIAPAAKDASYSFHTAYGPKNRVVDAITKFKVVVYEFDQLPGAEPVSAARSREMPGETTAAVFQLSDPKSETLSDFGTIRASAACSFLDARDELTDMGLPIGPGENIRLMLSANQHDDPVEEGVGRNRKIFKKRRWRLDAYLNIRKPKEAPEGCFYFVLLDADKRLVACGTSVIGVKHYIDVIAVPKDELFSVANVQAVIYTRPVAAKPEEKK
jgi:hypothetical protein